MGRIYRVWALSTADAKGEWLIEGREIAEAVLRRLRSAYPNTLEDSGMELAVVWDDDDAWADDAWPFARVANPQTLSSERSYRLG